ncbi:MAG TPA: hydrogenase maturation nickel metallochaperone HypA [Kofleriaceae bacterium]|nr:hydrogenase maturation nickel metallochaperone HypA [Kofleriaceae bacterium]
MHEYSIVASLVDRVQREIDAHPGAVARRLHVRIGELAGVEIDLLRTAYDTFRARSACADAELAIERIATTWRCKACGRDLPAGAILRCCGRPATLATGDEIVLERVELEVPDV